MGSLKLMNPLINIK